MKARGGRIRAIATARNGSIVENAVLVQGLSGVEKAFVIWELASAVTLQKYLSDITKSLTRIESGLHDVLGRLDDEVDGKLRANGDAVFRIAQELRRASFGPHELSAYMVQLDDVDRESAGIGSACAQEARRRLDELKGLHEQSGNWKDREERAIELLMAACRAEDRAALAIVIASGAAHLRALVSASPKVLRERLDARRASMKTLRDQHTAFKEACQGRLDDVKGIGRKPLVR